MTVPYHSLLIFTTDLLYYSMLNLVSAMSKLWFIQPTGFGVSLLFLTERLITLAISASELNQVGSRWLRENSANQDVPKPVVPSINDFPLDDHSSYWSLSMVSLKRLISTKICYEVVCSSCLSCRTPIMPEEYTLSIEVLWHFPRLLSLIPANSPCLHEFTGVKWQE